MIYVIDLNSALSAVSSFVHSSVLIISSLFRTYWFVFLPLFFLLTVLCLLRFIMRSFKKNDFVEDVDCENN